MIICRLLIWPLLSRLRVQVGSKTDCVMCFGPMVPDGYGVCYNPMDEHINIAITAFNSCEETNAAKFAQAVEDALLDMRALLEDTASAKQWSHAGAWLGVCVPPGCMGAGTEPVPESLAECHTDIGASCTQCAGAEGKPVIEWLWEVECVTVSTLPLWWKFYIWIYCVIYEL